MQISEQLEVTIPEYLKAAVAILGVPRLDYEYVPKPGDFTYLDTFAYPVHYRVVKGLSYQMWIAGEVTPEVKEEFIAAISTSMIETIMGSPVTVPSRLIPKIWRDPTLGAQASYRPWHKCQRYAPPTERGGYTYWDLFRCGFHASEPDKPSWMCFRP